MVAETRKVTLPELRNVESGRLDARRIAEYLDVPLSRWLPPWGGRTKPFQGPGCTPLQAGLRPIESSLRSSIRSATAPQSWHGSTAPSGPRYADIDEPDPRRRPMPCAECCRTLAGIPS
jgi:hypothetical protein